MYRSIFSLSVTKISNITAILLEKQNGNQQVDQDPQSQKDFQKPYPNKRTHVESCDWLYLSLIDTENSSPFLRAATWIALEGVVAQGEKGGGFVASIYRLIKGDTWPTRRPFLFPATDRKPPHPLIFDALVVRGLVKLEFPRFRPLLFNWRPGCTVIQIVSDLLRIKLVSSVRRCDSQAEIVKKFFLGDAWRKFVYT